MLLLGASQLAERRRVVNRELQPLMVSLAGDLAPLLGSPPYIPTGKALLSRIGGRCESDGTDLAFDPHSPHTHRCPACGREHSGDWHDRWWLYPYHLWLAERAVHAATLHALEPDEGHAALARDILTGYAAQYLDYANEDNVLGPSRLFFSTYLESLWLLHITIAADLLDHAGDPATAEIVRDRIAEPAVALVETFHEGTSNRQVWNNAAIVSARALLGEPADSPAIAGALADAESTLTQATGDDGAWYEGDNYHQFAHRGMWYVFALGDRLGYDFQQSSVARFNAGFAAPFRAALPDFTYPARKDSRYAASLRQWRFAESCELGLARTDDPLLRWALGRMYADDLPPGDTGRARSSGEAERHVAPVRLSRADLGWRSLLFARPTIAAGGDAPPSLTIESQGLTIHRRDEGSVYVALDWGESGGGHGHPDRLNLLFAHGSTRWLDDLGTGSYVDPSLHWYRSTLAHNAPLVNGASQRRVNGELLAHGGGRGFDVVVARADGIAPGVRVERTVLTGSAYFIDEVRWWAERSVRFELPVHFDGDAAGLRFTPAALDGADGIEDGFGAVRDTERAIVRAGTPVRIAAEHPDASASATVWSNGAIEWFRARAPGQPAHQLRRFQVLRQVGTHGVIRTAWSWHRDAEAVFGATGVEVTVAGATDRHDISDRQWRVQCANGNEIRLDRPDDGPAAGSARPAVAGPAERAEVAPPDGSSDEDRLELAASASSREWFSDALPESRAAWQVFELGKEHYRQSEEPWQAAGRPAARVAIRAENDAVVIEVFVETTRPTFVPAGATNPYDNEHADINGHGVQLYFGAPDEVGGWMLVPEAPGPAVRVRRLSGWGRANDPHADWREVRGGFELRARMPFRGARGRSFVLDVLVNDASPERTRRRGQLVLSGGGGFVYLRGDRHDPSSLIPFRVT